MSDNATEVSSRERIIRKALEEGDALIKHFNKGKTIEDVNVGVQYDAGKPRVDLIPEEAILAMGRGFGAGTSKYPANNWRKGIKLTRHLASIVRHVFAFMCGTDMDEETGVLHTDLIITRAAMICQTLKDHPTLDDRYKGE